MEKFDIHQFDFNPRVMHSAGFMERFFNKLILEKVMKFVDTPGAQNLVGTMLANNVNPLTIASAASLANAISYAITFVSGTNAMTGFQLPAGFKGCFVVIPTAASTGATGGTYANDGTTASIPIGLNHTNVALRAQLYVTNGLLVYPSYV